MRRQTFSTCGDLSDANEQRHKTTLNSQRSCPAVVPRSEDASDSVSRPTGFPFAPTFGFAVTQFRYIIPGRRVQELITRRPKDELYFSCLSSWKWQTRTAHALHCGAYKGRPPSSESRYGTSAAKETESHDRVAALCMCGLG